MNDRIAVIGSNSFSGANFIDHLLDNGIETIGISRSPEIDTVFLPYKKNKNVNKYRFYQYDLNKDLENIIGLFNEFKPEYIVNFAAQGMVAQSWLYPEHWFQTNTLANVKLHERLRKLDFLKKYIHISTPEVYGSCSGLIPENINYNPSTPYAVSRAAADMSLMTFYKNYQFPVIFTRSANVYGPHQQLYRIIPRAILFFLIGRKLSLDGGGHSIRSFIHIKDVADGTLKAARLGKPGSIFHFSTSRNISVREVVEMIAGLLDVSFDENVNVVSDRPGKDAAYLLDNSKAKNELGWSDKISLEQGIKDTISWVKDNLETLKKQEFEYIHKP